MSFLAFVSFLTLNKHDKHYFQDMKATVKRHKPTGALVWFPNDGMSGLIVQAAHPWKLGMVSSHWDFDDLEQTEFEIEIKLKRKEK